MERLVRKFENFEFITIDGSHHLHMDDDTSQLVELIQNCFSSPVELLGDGKANPTGT